MAPKGRPRLTPVEYQDRLQSYCRRYNVTATEAGIPPFPSGRRETDQHREWLALYKAHARLRTATAPREDGKEDGSSCGVCGRPLDPAEAVAHAGHRFLHPACHAVVAAVEPLGPEGLDRLRGYLWPSSKKASGGQRRPGRR